MSVALPRDHAHRMDATYRWQRHVYDATRKFYLLGRDRMIRDLAPPPGGSVVEIGCGTARNLIAAARRWPDARLFGLDISEEMLATAQGSVKRAGLADRITLVQGDAATFTAGDFGLASIDRVFMSYTLSMIPDWTGTIARGVAALAPAGRLHIVDFGQQERLPTAWRTLLFAWLDRFDVDPRGDLPAVIARIADAHAMAPAFTRMLRGYAWSATITHPIR